MKARLQSPVSLYKGMVPERRRFVGLLAALTAVVPLLPRLLSKLPGRELSLHEADFYRRHELND
ncbi:MAG: hypothetical protein U9P00_07425 [Pseudomonadota bacterium]|nr:hypothetical protein [Pseudomonadota bacterium]